MAELPRIKVVSVSKTGGWDREAQLELPKNLQVQVVVMNPSDEVYKALRRLVNTDALITLGDVPKESV